MARKLNDSNVNFSDSLKIEGDIGDLQLVEEETSDCEDEDVDKKISRTNNNINIPPNLIQNTVPVFGKVSVTDSEHVQFGNNTYFNGPVTIKQIIQEKTGIDNASFVKTEEDTITKDPKKDIEQKSTPKEKILIWHKVTFSAVCITVIGSIVAIVLVLQTKSGIKPETNSKLNFDTKFETLAYVVVGSYFEILQVIIISMILLPLTAVIVYYLLLTIERIGNRMICHIICGKKNKCRLCFNKYNVAFHEEDDPLLIAADHLRIVPRTDWLAQPVEGPLTKLRHPTPWVIIAHTATESCSSQSECVYQVRTIQSFHIESKGWFDIAYNFLVGGDGSVYYGRGWDYEGAHTKGYNKYSISIAFIGTFKMVIPPKKQLEACQKIIKQGVRLGKLAKDYKLFAHRQLMSTQSPGDQIYNIMQTWPHFVKNVTDFETLIPKY